MLIFCIAGCSGSTLPTSPADGNGGTIPAANIGEYQSRSCWGLWQFVCDPASGTVDVVPLRDPDFHLNALKFLEPPAGMYLTLESPPHYTGKILDIDIGLRHPFLGAPQFTGFDVCGIFISRGSVTGFSDPDIVYAGDGDTRLLNADGYTRWWNPTEFPYDEEHPIYGYVDGLMGMLDSAADYNATINGYKYFADSLDANSPAWAVPFETRGMFAAGQKNIRHYKISLDAGFVFNYAIDANWKPCGLPPQEIHPPDSFSPGANRPEAWAASITELENTLYFEESTGLGGGELSLELKLYDWYDADDYTITAESLTGIPSTTAPGPIDGGENYSTYKIDLPGTELAANGDIEILITAASSYSGYGGILPGKTVSNYFVCSVNVDSEGPQQSTTEFYISGDKSNWGWELYSADNLEWFRNLYLNATGAAGQNDIVMFYHGHGGYEMPEMGEAEFFAPIIADGYTPVKSDIEPIDTTGCRMIMTVMPGRWTPSLYSDDEIADLKQFVKDGGMLIITGEVDYAWGSKVTFNDMIKRLGSGCVWGGDYIHPDYGDVYETDEFDHDHPMFANCSTIKWNLPSYVITSKPTDKIIAWGKYSEALLVASPVSD